MEQKSRKKHAGGVYNLNYHIVWSPKRRSPVLVGAIADETKDLLLSKALEIGANIETIEVMPDHVHLFVSAPPSLSPHVLVKKLKGACSRALRNKYVSLDRLGSLWSSSYYIGSVGTVSESVVRMYIENQKRS